MKHYFQKNPNNKKDYIRYFRFGKLKHENDGTPEKRFTLAKQFECKFVKNIFGHP